MDKSRKRTKNSSSIDEFNNKRKNNNNVPSSSLLSNNLTMPLLNKTSDIINTSNNIACSNDGADQDSNIFKFDNSNIKHNINNDDINSLSRKINDIKLLVNEEKSKNNICNESDDCVNGLDKNYINSLASNNNKNTTQHNLKKNSDEPSNIENDKLENKKNALESNKDDPGPRNIGNDKLENKKNILEYNKINKNKIENTKTLESNKTNANNSFVKIYEKIEKITKQNTDQSKNKDIKNSNGLWWNFIRPDNQNQYMRLKPENILTNYIFQSKCCCAAFYNDDLFNYISIENLFLHISSSDLHSTPNGSLDYSLEMDPSDLLIKFSSTTDEELFMRALLIATETKIEFPTPTNLSLNEMRIYEKLNNCKIILGGEYEDWLKLKKMLCDFKSRCEHVIKAITPDQASRLISINTKISTIVDNIIEHKFGVLNGQFWNNLLWYHYDTFEFSGLLCDLAITTTFKHGNSIHINNVLSESAKLVLGGGSSPLDIPEYDIITTIKTNPLNIQNCDITHVQDFELNLFQSK